MAEPDEKKKSIFYRMKSIKLFSELARRKDANSAIKLSESVKKYLLLLMSSCDNEYFSLIFIR